MGLWVNGLGVMSVDKGRTGLGHGVDKGLCGWDGAMKIGKGGPVIVNQ